MRSAKGDDWKHVSFQSSELTSSYGHITITIIQIAIDEEDYNLPKTIFYNQGHKQGTTQGRLEDLYNQAP